MAANDKRRQKKIEDKRAKRKEQQRDVTRLESSGMVARMTLAKDWPLIETQISPEFVEQGIANAMIVRRGPYNQVAAAIFLLDIFCLGVKSAIAYVGPESKWRERIAQQRQNGMRFENIAPEALRKLVEGAVNYAQALGIAPHSDWRHAAPIFGDIDASQCPTEFTYGYEGKPHYIVGPHDSPERATRILQLLEANAGPDNYHFTAPIQADETQSGDFKSLDSETGTAIEEFLIEED
jgi:hypothetical protein